ncbi:hypothetical protein DFH09DRAFT_1072246 [Mycena vulgaris]|nr:hypothetical protein DFH09DRAFT_1072246 [Mycena vulgaris]
MPTLIFSCFPLEKSTQTLRLHVGNHDQELPTYYLPLNASGGQLIRAFESSPAAILRGLCYQAEVDLYDPLKRPSRPSFDGPLLEEKNGRRDGHGTRSTGAVEPSRRQRAAALSPSPGPAQARRRPWPGLGFAGPGLAGLGLEAEP